VRVRAVDELWPAHDPKQAKARRQTEEREAEEWQKKEEIFVKKAAHADLRIEEMAREMEELRQRARQTEQALDEEKSRSAQRERELKRQIELMSEAEDIARRRASANTMKVVKPIRASIKEQLFQRKVPWSQYIIFVFPGRELTGSDCPPLWHVQPLMRRELAGVVLKEGWLTKEGGLVRNWKKVGPRIYQHGVQELELTCCALAHQRWFVLQDGNLYYYENANKVTGKGCVLLEGCVVTPAEGETKKKNSFAVYHASRRTFYLRAADAKEMTEWIEATTEAITAREGGSGAGAPRRGSASDGESEARN
jgi:hypothetical protein